ncbi:MAG: UDP-N-acetylmuramate dehydrogenase [Defluviitaleaceae bacterium]|nr:UDP-N-acetylmuramate dehydrogenase [Defluviitaleaceae bacterium]
MHKLNEPLSAHTTFKVGGAADVFVQPANEDELLDILQECRKSNRPHLILGNGSNLLVRDRGFRGAVISLLGLNDMYLMDDDSIYAGAGVLMKDLAEFARDHSLADFEFAHGIPGTVGGGIFMNAGAYEGEMKGIFISARCIDAQGGFVEAGINDMDFGYRKSAAQSRGLTIVSAILKGRAGDKGEITAKMSELEAKRNEKQPLDMASAGSTFKRPPGHFAGKLIMDAGLRGYSIGGAQVSEKHCGFIVNKGDATSADILALIKYVQDAVQEKFGIKLETEVKIIGE